VVVVGAAVVVVVGNTVVVAGGVVDTGHVTHCICPGTAIPGRIRHCPAPPSVPSYLSKPSVVLVTGSTMHPERQSCEHAATSKLFGSTKLHEKRSEKVMFPVNGTQ
jgi:hypothetical protein